jgi:ferredoxin
MFNIFVLVLVIVILLLSIMNRANTRRLDEDIDEIRASLFELRKNSRAGQAEINRRFAEIRIRIMKAHNELPEDRIPYYINADCIACGTCLPECPVNAIHEGDIYLIDPEICIACKKCADVCPVHACQLLIES